MIFAIKRKKDGKFIRGTDFRYNPPRCLIVDNEDQKPMLFNKYDLESQIKVRKINLKNYDVVPVKIIEEKEENNK